jgi:hypothetical protein
VRKLSCSLRSKAFGYFTGCEATQHVHTVAHRTGLNLLHYSTSSAFNFMIFFIIYLIAISITHTADETRHARAEQQG